MKFAIISTRKLVSAMSCLLFAVTANVPAFSAGEYFQNGQASAIESDEALSSRLKEEIDSLEEEYNKLQFEGISVRELHDLSNKTLNLPPINELRKRLEAIGASEGTKCELAVTFGRAGFRYDDWHPSSWWDKTSHHFSPSEYLCAFLAEKVDESPNLVSIFQDEINKAKKLLADGVDRSQLESLSKAINLKFYNFFNTLRLRMYSAGVLYKYAMHLPRLEDKTLPEHLICKVFHKEIYFDSRLKLIQADQIRLVVKASEEDPSGKTIVGESSRWEKNMQPGPSFVVAKIDPDKKTAKIWYSLNGPFWHSGAGDGFASANCQSLAGWTLEAQKFFYLTPDEIQFSDLP